MLSWDLEVATFRGTERCCGCVGQKNMFVGVSDKTIATGSSNFDCSI